MVLLLLLVGCSGKSKIAGEWLVQGDNRHDPFIFVNEVSFLENGEIKTDSNRFNFEKYRFDSKEKTLKLISANKSEEMTFMLEETKDGFYLTDVDFPKEKKDMILIRKQ